jgi:hypothetical protein
MRSSGWFRSSAGEVAVNKRRGKTLAVFSKLLVGGGGRSLDLHMSIAVGVLNLGNPTC